MKPRNFPRAKEARKEEAIKRQEERAGRSNKQQLQRLDQTFGEGKGAVKERARLAKE